MNVCVCVYEYMSLATFENVSPRYLGLESILWRPRQKRAHNPRNDEAHYLATDFQKGSITKIEIIFLRRCGMFK